MTRKTLSEQEVIEALSTLPEWELKNGKLHKAFKFNSFAAAIGWMVTVSIYADKLDHHPEWSNIYNRVYVDLVTHDLGNVISSWDIQLAQYMESTFPTAEGK